MGILLAMGILLECACGTTQSDCLNCVVPQQHSEDGPQHYREHEGPPCEHNEQVYLYLQSHCSTTTFTPVVAQSNWLAAQGFSLLPHHQAPT